MSPSAVRLELPSRWRVHNSFHVSLVEAFRAGIQECPDPDQVLREAEAVEEEEDYEVESVRDSISEEGRVKYLVKWKGWPYRRHWTWEPLEHFTSPGAFAVLRR